MYTWRLLYLNRAHVIICLIFIQPGACSARYWLVSSQQSRPIRKQKHKKGINFYRCFDLQRHTSCKTYCQNNAIEGHKSVISVIKMRGIATFNINAHFCSGLVWDSVTMHTEAKQKSVKEIRKFHNLMQGAPWLMRFNFQGVHPGFRRLKLRVHPG